MTQDIVLALGTMPSRQAAGPSAVAAQCLATERVAAGALSVAIAGQAPLALPLRPQDLAALLSRSHPAPYGLREDTLLDTAVRDTCEIAADALQVDWDVPVLADILARMRATLGLPAQAILVPHLHNLLVYGPGQFFKPHQDSEKVAGMVASLVVVLPSPHSGGDLRVRHAGTEHVFTSENLAEQDLQCAAFYADCVHEIQPVRQGYRVALTYNLALQSSPALEAPEALPNPALDTALQRYFEAAEAGSPPKLAYLLDHRYTEHSLRWNLLKGVDGPRAQALVAAAVRLDLVPHLASVEIHESWSTDGEGEDAEPDDLIDDSMVLEFWVDAQGQPQPYRSTRLKPAQTCWSVALGDAHLVDTAFEGYMGNYGNTVDYWYQRAAVVLWRASDQIALGFDLNYAQAWTDLQALMAQPGHEEQAIHTVRQAGDFLFQSSPEEHNLNNMCQLALYVKNADVAHTVLHPYSLAQVGHGSVPWLKLLHAAYGTAWCVQVLEVWAEHARQNPWTRSKATVRADSWVQEAMALGVASDIVQMLLRYHVQEWMREDHVAVGSPPVVQMRGVPARLALLAQLVRACAALDDATLTASVVQHVVSHTPLYPAPDLVEMLAEVLAKVQQQDVDAVRSVASPLQAHAARAIRTEYAQGLRQSGDQSIAATCACSCKHCMAVLDFLRDPTESSRVWPLAEHYRTHVMDRFNGLGVPMAFEVVKQGSPYKLVARKSPKLYALAQARFERIAACHVLLAD
jgi:hypothetical protein